MPRGAVVREVADCRCGDPAELPETLTMTTTWRTDTPTHSGWFATDHDSALRRYFDGTDWSAPVHIEDFDRLGDRARRTPAEPRSTAEPITWRDDA